MIWRSLRAHVRLPLRSLSLPSRGLPKMNVLDYSSMDLAPPKSLQDTVDKMALAVGLEIFVHVRMTDSSRPELGLFAGRHRAEPTCLFIPSSALTMAAGDLETMISHELFMLANTGPDSSLDRAIAMGLKGFLGGIALDVARSQTGGYLWMIVPVFLALVIAGLLAPAVTAALARRAIFKADQKTVHLMGHKSTVDVLSGLMAKVGTLYSYKVLGRSFQTKYTDAGTGIMGRLYSVRPSLASRLARVGEESRT